MKPFNRKDFLKTMLGAGAAALFNGPFFDKFLDLKQKEPSIASLREDANDWDSVRELFPLQKSVSYFNTAGMGACPNSVLSSVNQNMLRGEIYSIDERNDLKNLKQSLGNFIGADPQDLAFTRNTTEGLNIIARELSFQKGDEIVITTHEHVGGASPWIMLEKELGLTVKLVELDLTGIENFELIKSKINSKTKLVCISHVCCTTGMVLPIQKISNYCKSLNVPLCVDGAQAPGLVPLNIQELDVDFYASSGHKWLFGPLGTGFLYVNKRALPLLKPLFAGAYSDKSFNLKKHQLEFENQVSRFEYGTRNISLIHGLIEAIHFHQRLGFEKEINRNQILADYFKSQLRSIKGVLVLSPDSPEFSSSMVTFKVQGIDFLKLRDILFKKYKHRIRGVYENDLDALRVCIAVYNSKPEIERLLSDLREISDQL